LIYVFDTSSFNVFKPYYPKAFPAFWGQIDTLVREGRLISVREVRKELDGNISKAPHLQDWIDKNKDIFLIPTDAETEFLAEIFAVPHFQQNVTQKQLYKGTPVADPFVIAAAKVRGADACVVTEEDNKPNSARIPNICQHFGVRCMNVEGFLEQEGWTF
jgi:Domain of unknown function (DUF4411)